MVRPRPPINAATLAPTGNSPPGHASTMPTHSMPLTSAASAHSPRRMCNSAWLMPNPRTLMTTSPSLGSGLGMSVYTRLSSPPNFSSTIARMVSPPGPSRTTAGAAGRADCSDSATDMTHLLFPILGRLAQYYGPSNPALSTRLVVRCSALGLAARGRPGLAGRRGRCERPDVLDRSVHRCAQRFWAIGDVSQQGSALMRGDQRDCQVSGVGVGT